MRETRGDIFKAECAAVCITTNGFVKTNGENVMGRGCAKRAAQLIPDLPRILGSKLRYGNAVYPLYENNGVTLCSFPVKPAYVLHASPGDVVTHMRDKFTWGERVPGWAAIADMEIIRRSAEELIALTDARGWQHVVLPRPGCGAGELSWEHDVGPLLRELLDDRFTCMTF